MKQREHAIEILEEVPEKRQGFFFWRERLEHTTGKDIAEDLGLPVQPLIIVDIRGGYHILERSVARLLIDPLNTFWRKYRKPR